MSTGDFKFNPTEKKETNFVDMSLSNHAVGTLMMCLQKCLMEQSDITPILKDLVFVEKDGELFCKNPPLVKVGTEEE